MSGKPASRPKARSGGRPRAGAFDPAPGGRSGPAISPSEALELLEAEGPELGELFARANRVRHERRGDVVGLCSIVNAKSGACGEDCAFCAQSRRARSGVTTYPLLAEERLLEAARSAEADRASCFSIVTSGRAPGPRDLRRVASAVGCIVRETRMRVSASLGILDAEALQHLRDAGLERYHHNLETAESFFPTVCTTRRWGDSVGTIEAARRLGLSTCCGGLFGLGESLRQRVELLAAVRDLDPESVPLNFLHPVPGTRLGERPLLEPLEALRIVAVARLMLPAKEIRVCGGREHVLGDLQSWIFLAGADGMMVGGYLTTPGRAVADDLRMIERLGLRPAPPPVRRRASRR